MTRTYVLIAVVALAACKPVGRPATDEEKAEMVPLAVSVKPDQVLVQRTDNGSIAGCEIAIDQRWRAKIPENAQTATDMQISTRDLRDSTNSSLSVYGSSIGRVDVVCPDPARKPFSGKKTGDGPTVLEWIWPPH